MAFSTNIADQRIEKHSLVIIRPRKRVTDWNIVSGIIYSKSFSLGKVTRVWNEYDNTNGLSEGGSPSVTLGQFYYDQSTETLYVGADVDPDTNTYPGMTVEFELNISDSPFTGPRNPLSNGSEVIDWAPYLKSIPQAQNGSSDTLYGFIPLIQSNLSLLNGDGFFNNLLHDCSFYYCPVFAYILANADYEKGVASSDVQQIFLGFSSGMEYRDDEINISCVDYNTFLDREFIPQKRMNATDFPLAEPESIVPGQEWYVRRIYGMVDGFRPINIDYSSSPSTTNNRDWIVRDLEPGTISDNAGNLNITVDHLAANTGTRTYFTTTPKFNIGDWITITNNSINYYVEVESVNRSLKYIDHEPLTRTITAGDSASRKDVARVIVMSENGAVPFWLRPGVDYSLFNDNTKNVSGFTMADNWESALGFTDNGGVFDPSKNQIYVRVYSSSSLGEYYSSNPVGSIPENSGRSTHAITILHKIIKASGFDISLIDENSFSSATNQSLGLSIPASHNQLTFPTYKSLISQILTSMLWKLSFVSDGGSLKLGLVEIGPFVSSGDYTADESDHYNFTYRQDYGDVYSDIFVNYSIKERVTDNILDSDTWEFKNGLIQSESGPAKSLHLISKRFSVDILQYDPAEAQIISDRFNIILSDRRGFYSIVLGQEFLNSTNLGASYILKSEKLPGFSFVYGTEQERQLSLVEVQKSSQAVTLTLEDQKSIQDNVGDW